MTRHALDVPVVRGNVPDTGRVLSMDAVVAATREPAAGRPPAGHARRHDAG